MERGATRVSAVLLYNSAVSGNCYKVRVLLAHLGISYEQQELVGRDHSNRDEGLGGLTPSLRIPTLVLDDGRAIGESGAILWFFGEGTRFVPDDPFERAQVLQWLFFEQYDAEPNLAVPRFWLVYSGRPEAMPDRLRGGARPGHPGPARPDPPPARREEWHRNGNRALAARDRHLGGRDWFVGESMTLADIGLYGYTHVADEGGFELERYLRVGQWLPGGAAQPGHVPIEA